MYYDSKHLMILTDRDYQTPRLFLDFFKVSPSKRHQRDCNTLYIILGFNTRVLTIELKWGHK